MEIILLLLLLLVVFIFSRYFRVLRGIYSLYKSQRHYKERYEEAQRRAYEEEHGTRGATSDPEKSSVDVIHQANLDLDGGDYIEYEEVKDSNK